MAESIDWYERRHELRPGMVFRVFQHEGGGIVRLERRVPGDGTKWVVADWDGSWAHYDGTLEPGDLAIRLPEMEDADA